MNIVIKSGPFAGTQVPASELVLITTADGQPLEWWPVHARTGAFLDAFPPTDGWSIEITSSQGVFNLPDYKGQVAGGEVLVQPTHLFIATLKRDGRIVNQASSLEIIDGPKAWERGETNARGRLYDALGLPGAPGGKASVAPDYVPVTPTIEPVGPATVTQQDATAGTTASVKEDAPVPTAAKAPEPLTRSAIDANLLQQVHSMARMKGIEVPQFNDQQEAKDFLRDLLLGRAPA